MIAKLQYYIHSAYTLDGGATETPLHNSIFSLMGGWRVLDTLSNLDTLIM